jgi:hypothetical protein
VIGLPQADRVAVKDGSRGLQGPGFDGSSMVSRRDTGTDTGEPGSEFQAPPVGFLRRDATAPLPRADTVG